VAVPLLLVTLGDPGEEPFDVAWATATRSGRKAETGRRRRRSPTTRAGCASGRAGATERTPVGTSRQALGDERATGSCFAVGTMVTARNRYSIRVEEQTRAALRCTTDYTTKQRQKARTVVPLTGRRVG
jgi:hypothetical protein